MMFDINIYMTELIKDNLSADLEFVWTLHSPLIWLHFEYFDTSISEDLYSMRHLFKRISHYQ